MAFRSAAVTELIGVGTAQQWEEKGERAYHIRRRLTPKEQARVGPVLDIRGTDEARRRFEVVRQWLPVGYPQE